MTIYAKVGTGPGKLVHVCKKHKLPVVGEIFKIKEHNNEPGWKYEHPSSVRLTEIRGNLFLLERF